MRMRKNIMIFALLLVTACELVVKQYKIEEPEPIVADYAYYADVSTWTDGRIPYRFEDNVSDAMRQSIEHAMELWETASNYTVIFVRLADTDYPNYPFTRISSSINGLSPFNDPYYYTVEPMGSFSVPAGRRVVYASSTAGMATTNPLEGHAPQSRMVFAENLENIPDQNYAMHIYVHELGHLLGLQHEELSYDNEEDMIHGPYDPYSVMIHSDNRAEPSEQDGEAIRRLYHNEPLVLAPPLPTLGEDFDTTGLACVDPAGRKLQSYTHQSTFGTEIKVVRDLCNGFSYSTNKLEFGTITFSAQFDPKAKDRQYLYTASRQEVPDSGKDDFIIASDNGKLIAKYQAAHSHKVNKITINDAVIDNKMHTYTLIQYPEVDNIRYIAELYQDRKKIATFGDMRYGAFGFFRIGQSANPELTSNALRGRISSLSWSYKVPNHRMILEKQDSEKNDHSFQILGSLYKRGIISFKLKRNEVNTQKQQVYKDSQMELFFENVHLKLKRKDAEAGGNSVEKIDNKHSIGETKVYTLEKKTFSAKGEKSPDVAIFIYRDGENIKTFTLKEPVHTKAYFNNPEFGGDSKNVVQLVSWNRQGENDILENPKRRMPRSVLNTPYEVFYPFFTLDNLSKPQSIVPISGNEISVDPSYSYEPKITGLTIDEKTGKLSFNSLSSLVAAGGQKITVKVAGEQVDVPLQIRAANKTELKALIYRFINDPNIGVEGNYNVINTSRVRDMSSLFNDGLRGNGDILESFNGDISAWDTANVTDMSYMFSGAADFNQNIGRWDTSQVRNMSFMFFRAAAFNEDIGHWDTAQVTNMSYMFYGAKVFNQNIGYWNTSNMLTLHRMFEDAHDFDQDISGWDVSNVKNIAGMFRNAYNFNQHIGNWDTSSVEQMFHMFRGTKKFNQDISHWKISNVKNMSLMFYGAIAFAQNISGWDVSKVRSFSNMFSGATAFNDANSSGNETDPVVYFTVLHRS